MKRRRAAQQLFRVGRYLQQQRDDAFHFWSVGMLGTRDVNSLNEAVTIIALAYNAALGEL